ncbi:MAG: Uma2 family endonuclease [Planctomycetaceae bacterium]
MSAAEAIAYTPDDLLTMPDGKHYELVDGELRETTMGAEAEWVAGEVLASIRNRTTRPRHGWVFGAATGYQCFADDPGKVRKPDVSFIRLGRLPNEEIPKGHIRIPPDLAIEVVSPQDAFSEVQAKVDQYLDAGVQLVWVIDPETRKVSVWRQDGSTAVLRASQTLCGEDVVPDFTCSVADLFPPSADS